jgi:hypothetical protein
VGRKNRPPAVDDGVGAVGLLLRRWPDDTLIVTIPTSRRRVPPLAPSIALAGVFLLSGCGGSSAPAKAPAVTTATSAPQSSSATAQRGFLALAANGAIFIQWTRTGNTVTGTLSEAYTNLSDPTQPAGESHSFTGIISGSSVTLTIDSGENWNGTLRGSRVTLSYTSSDGSLQTFDFHSASVADYNAAVAAVKGRAVGEKEREAQREAITTLKQRIEDEGSSVASDLGRLAEDVASVQSDMKAIAGSVTTAASDTRGTYKEMLSVLAEAQKHPDGDYGTVCADASSVGADASSVEADESSVEADGQSLDYDLDAVASDVKTLINDSQAFQVAQDVLPTYQPANAVDQPAVLRAIAKARAASAFDRRARTSYIAKAKGLVTTANGYASRAQAACDKTGG